MIYTNIAGEQTEGTVWSPGSRPHTVWVLDHSGAGNSGAHLVKVNPKAGTAIEVAPPSMEPESLSASPRARDNERQIHYVRAFKYAPKLNKADWEWAIAQDADQIEPALFDVEPVTETVEFAPPVGVDAETGICHCRVNPDGHAPGAVLDCISTPVDVEPVDVEPVVETVVATDGPITVTLTPMDDAGDWIEQWTEDGDPFGDAMVTPLREDTPQQHAQAAAARLAGQTHPAPVVTTRQLGPIILERQDSVDDFLFAEEWFGVNPGTGDAVFVQRWRDEQLLSDEKDAPWTAQLWIGWEDGSRNHPADDQRYGTLDGALSAVERRCAGLAFSRVRTRLSRQ